MPGGQSDGNDTPAVRDSTTGRNRASRAMTLVAVSAQRQLSVTLSAHQRTGEPEAAPTATARTLSRKPPEGVA